MPLTRSFRETVASRAQRDPAFRAALVEEALQAFVDGEVDDALALLRDCVNGTAGFEQLSAEIGVPVKSLMRMLGPNGNPTARNLGSIIRAVQRAAGVRAQVEAKEDARATARRPKRELETT